MAVHSGTRTEDLWLRRYEPAGAGGPPLVCVPHAGGSATQYFPLSQALAPTVDTLAVQLPGHQDRRDEACVEDLARLADDLFAIVRGRLDLPVALFGHSMGALLAWEVAARLERTEGPGSVAHLFVSGRRAPSCQRVEDAHLLDDEGLKGKVRELGGTEPALLENEQMLELILPVLRSDYKAVATHHPDPTLRLTCPVTVLTGDRDPHVSLLEARRWTDHTTGDFQLRVFPGGHFYLNGHVREIADVVLASLRGGELRPSA